MHQRLVDSSRRRRERSKRHARTGLAARPLEALEVRSLLSQVFTVTNSSDNTSMGSLRWAIGQVNSDGTDTAASPDQIRFNIPQADPGFGLVTPGVWTIAPATVLPIINAPCVIDGYTQTGAAAGTSEGAINATIKIELDGWANQPAAPGFPYGLQFGPGAGNTTGGTTSGVEGLAIHLFDNDVQLDGSGVFVQGCFLGVNAAGMNTHISLVDNGVAVDAGSNGDLIGGTTPADRNYFANLFDGIQTGVGGASNNLLAEGNLIGTNLAGTQQFGNSTGIDLGAGTGNTVGGTTPGARNVISGNLGDGIRFEAGSNVDLVEGNYIGTDVTGTKAVGNFNAGIGFMGGTNNVIGGTTPAAANVISGNALPSFFRASFPGAIEFYPQSAAGGESDNLVEGNLIGTDATGRNPIPNGGNGIRVDGEVNNAFLDNIIAFNGALGIDLNGGTQNSYGVTANTPGGPHSGPNDLQNYPVLTSAIESGGQTTIMGTLNSNPSSIFRVDLYAVPTADPSGHGQALTFLGTTNVETDGSGNTITPFSLTVPVDLLGQQITSLATFVNTDLAPPRPSSTSEFSADIPVTAAPRTPTITGLTASPNPSTAGQPVLFSAVITPVVPQDGPTGTVVFLVDGKMAATAPVGPLPDGGPDDGLATFLTSSLGPGNHTVTAVYSGDASFGASTSASVVETVVTPVPPPPPVNPAPRIVEVLRYGYHAAPTALAVVFDRPLNAATAEATDNYVLVGPHRQMIPILKASLAPGGEVVVLQPSRRLNIHWTYTLTITGTPPYGVASSAETFIGFDPVEAITLHNLVWRRTPAAASRARPSAHAVDALLAAEYRAPLRASAALRHRR